jgi:ribose transport system permease protein
MATIDSAVGTTPAAGAARSRKIAWKTELERFGLPLAWLLQIAAFGLAGPPEFMSWPNFASMFGSQAVLVVLTLAMLIPLTAGDFDLSLASTMTMASMSTAMLGQHGAPVSAIIPIALLLGAVIGGVNAAFILYFRIHSLIVTIGVSTAVNGILLWMSDSQTISGVPDDLVNWVVVERLFGIPLSFYYALLVALAMWYFLEFTTIGRRLLFVGRGREVARLNGIRVERMRGGGLIAAGMIAAFAGVLYSGTTGSADPQSGLQLMLPAFAAAFLGATSIVPGRFNPFGAVVAVYFLVTGISGLTMLGAQSYVQNLFYGGALVIAVALSQLVRNRRPQNFS